MGAFIPSKNPQRESERGSSGGGVEGGWSWICPCVHTMHCCSTAAATHTRTGLTAPCPVQFALPRFFAKPQTGLCTFLPSVTTDDVLEDRVGPEDVAISQRAVATVNQHYATLATADIKSGRSEKKRNCCLIQSSNSESMLPFG